MMISLPKRIKTIGCFSIAGLGVHLAATVEAGCPCSEQGGSGHSVESGETLMGHPQMALPPPRAVMPRRSLPAVVPPPGTLGRTYRQASRPIPDDKHPRTGMLVVWNVPGDALVWVKNMDGFRDECGAWHFESEKPLLRGIPHIYTVKMRRPSEVVDTHADFRVVRLIPGREVDLSF